MPWQDIFDNFAEYQLGTDSITKPASNENPPQFRLDGNRVTLRGHITFTKGGVASSDFDDTNEIILFTLLDKYIPTGKTLRYVTAGENALRGNRAGTQNLDNLNYIRVQGKDIATATIVFDVETTDASYEAIAQLDHTQITNATKDLLPHYETLVVSNLVHLNNGARRSRTVTLTHKNRDQYNKNYVEASKSDFQATFREALFQFNYKQPTKHTVSKINTIITPVFSGATFGQVSNIVIRTPSDIILGLEEGIKAVIPTSKQKTINLDGISWFID